ncbi:putative histidinol-phosphate aminotransferase [Lyophyllum shimeji]|uniref:histidinol-phosphate transaminase n=1 Tax=Lyophyllum shimeji TaxID=47721 RepID=A0A9P3PMY8_LYOSH|nr:putative histidinol-phosphate aminotransferase [Lyophyllum shimeji]
MPIHGLPPSSTPLRPAHFSIEAAIRPNILALHPYRCARDDYQSGILLDANENALGHSIVPSPSPSSGSAEVDGPGKADLDATLALPLHRYPDPSHAGIKARIAALRGLPGADRVFLGVGSDEVIDLLQRVCVRPGGAEKILVTPPTYGMYAVCAQVNDVGVVRVPLELGAGEGEGGERGRFSLRVDEIKKAIDADPGIKLVFLCSPGNPTGTLLSLASVRAILSYPKYRGVVVVDEAYIDFAASPEAESAVTLVEEFANLVVMQTLSKGFGLAAIRLGIALAQPPLIQVLTNTKAPYNISTPTAHLALSALSPASLALTRSKIETLREQRARLLKMLRDVRGVGSAIGAADANFVLVPILARDAQGQVDDERARRVYKKLAEERGVVVRYRGSEMGCEACLRITVGSEEENKVAVERLRAVLDVL